MDWTQKIARLALVKNSLYEADTRKIWPYYLPELAATIDDVIKLKLYWMRKLINFTRAFFCMQMDGKAFINM